MKADPADHPIRCDSPQLHQYRAFMQAPFQTRVLLCSCLNSASSQYESHTTTHRLQPQTVSNPQKNAAGCPTHPQCRHRPTIQARLRGEGSSHAERKPYLIHTRHTSWGIEKCDAKSDVQPIQPTCGLSHPRQPAPSEKKIKKFDTKLTS